MRLVRFVTALVIGVLATHMLPPDIAIWVLIGSLVIGIGPITLARLLFGLALILLAFGPR